MFWLSPRVCQVSFRSGDAGISPRGRSDRLRKSVVLASEYGELPFVKENGSVRRLTQFAAQRGAGRAPRRAQGRRENGAMPCVCVCARVRCLSLFLSLPTTKLDPREGGAARFRNATVIIGYKVIPARLGTCIDARTPDDFVLVFETAEVDRLFSHSLIFFGERLIRRAVAVIRWPCIKGIKRYWLNKIELRPSILCL